MKKLQYKPKSKYDEHLIKYCFRLAFELKQTPSLDQLNSETYSKSSWSKRLNNNIIFLAKFNNECEKKLKKSNLGEQNKNIVIEIQNFIKKKIELCTSLEKSKTGITHKNRPDFNDNIEKNSYTDEEYL